MREGSCECMITNVNAIERLQGLTATQAWERVISLAAHLSLYLSLSLNFYEGKLLNKLEGTLTLTHETQKQSRRNSKQYKRSKDLQTQPNVQRTIQTKLNCWRTHKSRAQLAS